MSSSSTISSRAGERLLKTHSIRSREILKETQQLSQQNFKLADIIANNRALELYLEQIEEERELLSGKHLVPKAVAKHALDESFKEEIQQLYKNLEICKEREESMDFEYECCLKEFEKTESSRRDTVEELEKVKAETELARKKDYSWNFI